MICLSSSRFPNYRGNAEDLLHIIVSATGEQILVGSSKDL